MEPSKHSSIKTVSDAEQPPQEDLPPAQSNTQKYQEILEGIALPPKNEMIHQLFQHGINFYAH